MLISLPPSSVSPHTSTPCLSSAEPTGAAGLLERFWAKVNIGNPDECWEWTASRNKKGYGRFKASGVVHLAHRFCWDIHGGDLPKGMYVCHHCDNPPCVNPAHLYLGTSSQNRRDALARGCKPVGVKGVRNVNAVLTEDDVREMRRLHRDFGLGNRRLSRQFGVCRRTIDRILNNEGWTHV